ncbi:glycine C-acetyltransferase [Myxococcota bacterium]
MAKKLLAFLEKETSNLHDAGLYRKEDTIRSAQEERVTIRSRKLINLASNNYLGFANHPELKAAAKQAIDEYGVGVASPRVVGGTQTIHVRLERALAAFLRTEDALICPSRYHANTGLFESLLGERDFIFCDAFCHPSLADGVRLSRARVLLYRNNDLNHLEDRLRRSRAARFRIIVTDGVFSLDGVHADLAGICALASKFNAVVVVDDSQGIGVMGANGRGTAEQLGVMSKVDVVTGTFGHALGGTGGYVSGRRQIVSWLRQKSRPCLVSNALDPGSVGGALRALGLLEEATGPLERLQANVVFFRDALMSLGFRVIEGTHPIVAVLVGDAVSAQRMVDKLHSRNIYSMGFCYPVVPEGEARIRVQITAQLERQTLDRVVRAFESAGKKLGLI